MKAETENTMRALANQVPLATSVLCKFKWHKWTVWSDPQKERLDTYYKQNRHCACCGEAQLREVRPKFGA